MYLFKWIHPNMWIRRSDRIGATVLGQVPFRSGPVISEREIQLQGIFGFVINIVFSFPLFVFLCAHFGRLVCAFEICTLFDLKTHSALEVFVGRIVHLERLVICSLCAYYSDRNQTEYCMRWSCGQRVARNCAERDKADCYYLFKAEETNEEEVAAVQQEPQAEGMKERAGRTNNQTEREKNNSSTWIDKHYLINRCCAVLSEERDCCCDIRQTAVFWHWQDTQRPLLRFRFRGVIQLKGSSKAGGMNGKELAQISRRFGFRIGSVCLG